MNDPLDSLKQELCTYLTDRRQAYSKTDFTWSFLSSLILSIDESGNSPSCGDFVIRYMTEHQIEVDQYHIYKSSDIIRNESVLFYEIFETYKVYCRINKLKRKNFSEKNISSQFELLSEKKWESLRDDLRAVLSLEKDAATFDLLLETLTFAICGKIHMPDSLEYKLAKAFLAHWAWQVMRKLHYGAKSIKRFGNESMLVLYSPEQKNGKSVTVNKLTHTFDTLGFCWKADFSRLEDSFSMRNLALNYIVIFDEMARASASNMSKFKHIVTEEDTMFRGMYTQKEHKMPKLCSMIGTTNTTCRMLFNDTTGLRRFHEIRVNGLDVGGIDLITLDTFDFAKFLKLVPAQREISPLFDYITEADLRKYENWMRPRHVVELWLEDTEYTVSDQKGSILLPLSTLYDNFSSWAAKSGYRQPYVPNLESFRKKLEELGGIKGRTTKSGKTYRGYYIIPPKDININALLGF